MFGLFVASGGALSADEGHVLDGSIMKSLERFLRSFIA